MKLEELIDGEIYYESSKAYPFIFQYYKRKNKTVGYKNYLCITNSRFYFNVNSQNGSETDTISIATIEQKHWLNACIEAKKFISKEEALYLFNPLSKEELEKIDNMLNLFDQI